MGIRLIANIRVACAVLCIFKRDPIFFHVSNMKVEISSVFKGVFFGVEFCEHHGSSIHFGWGEIVEDDMGSFI